MFGAHEHEVWTWLWISCCSCELVDAFHKLCMVMWEGVPVELCECLSEFHTTMIMPIIIKLHTTAVNATQKLQLWPRSSTFVWHSQPESDAVNKWNCVKVTLNVNAQCTWWLRVHFACIAHVLCALPRDTCIALYCEMYCGCAAGEYGCGLAPWGIHVYLMCIALYPDVYRRAWEYMSNTCRIHMNTW